MKILPAVSVIVPMYNAEKFLSVCLESILIQTLTDFELLIVDDCSTDSSVTIAENYLEKFGGRMKIISLPENTGSGAVPRNVGLDLSCGKYVYFIDADDFLIDTALEELFNTAEKFQADVVYMGKYFSCDENLIPENVTPVAWCYSDSSVDKPTFETDDISNRVEKFLQATFCWAPWSKFSRREFFVDNAIKFPRMRISEDVLWTFKMLCLAKNFLRIPMPLYVHRENTNSMMLRERTPEQTTAFWTSPLITGADVLDEFMRGQKFFRDNPVIRLQVLIFFVTFQLGFIEEQGAEVIRLEFTEEQAVESIRRYEVFLREFSRAGSPNAALISYLLIMNNLYRNELRKRVK